MPRRPVICCAARDSVRCRAMSRCWRVARAARPPTPLLDFTPKAFTPSGPDFATAVEKWIKYMWKARSRLQEKLVLFWHDHFATGFAKVQNVRLMATQNRTIRLNCKGDMRTLVKAMNTDAAMMVLLDTVQNHKDVPNENYGRELQELFTLGVDDLAGNPNYTQTDVEQIARAFTGWTVDPGNGKVSFDDRRPRHDRAVSRSWRRHEAGLRFHRRVRQPPRFDQPEGASEIDQVIDVIFRHRDTDLQNTVARRTTRRLLEYFCHGGWATPDAGMIQTMDAEIIAPSGFDRTFVIADVLRAIFVHDVFYATMAAAPFSAATVKSVKWPIDYALGTLRLLGVKLKGKHLLVQGGSFTPITDHLSNMGQTLLDPPSVFGWDWETSWISSATLLARYTFARDVTGSRTGGGHFRPEQLVDLDLTAAGRRASTPSPASSASPTSSKPEQRQVLIDYLTDGGVNPTINLHDPDRSQHQAERPLRAGARIRRLPAPLGGAGDTRMAITRRQFLTAERHGRGRHAARPEPVARNPFVREALASTIGDRYFVVIYLDGGNDGLNTVVPYSSGALRAAYDGYRRTGGGGINLSQADARRHRRSARTPPARRSSRSIPHSPDSSSSTISARWPSSRAAAIPTTACRTTRRGASGGRRIRRPAARTPASAGWAATSRIPATTGRRDVPGVDDRQRGRRRAPADGHGRARHHPAPGLRVSLRHL